MFSPEHDGSWADLDDKHAGLAMAAIRDRMEDHARRSTVRYTQAIVNAGREAGASLEHPHGQLLGIPFVPGEIAEEEAGFRRFGESCLLCTMAEAELQVGHRVVLDGRAGRWSSARTGAALPTRCSCCPAPTRSTSRTRPRPMSWRSAAPSATSSRAAAITRRRRRLQPRVPHRAAPPRGPVPLARPHRAAPHEPGRVRTGHRRDDQHRRPGARRPTPDGVAVRGCATCAVGRRRRRRGACATPSAPATWAAASRGVSPASRRACTACSTASSPAGRGAGRSLEHEHQLSSARSRRPTRGNRRASPATPPRGAWSARERPPPVGLRPAGGGQVRQGAGQTVRGLVEHRGASFGRHLGQPSRATRPLAGQEALEGVATGRPGRWPPAPSPPPTDRARPRRRGRRRRPPAPAARRDRRCPASPRRSPPRPARHEPAARGRRRWPGPPCGRSPRPAVAAPRRRAGAAVRSVGCPHSRWRRRPPAPRPRAARGRPGSRSVSPPARAAPVSPPARGGHPRRGPIGRRFPPPPPARRAPGAAGGSGDGGRMQVVRSTVRSPSSQATSIGNRIPIVCTDRARARAGAHRRSSPVRAALAAGRPGCPPPRAKPAPPPPATANPWSEGYESERRRRVSGGSAGGPGGGCGGQRLRRSPPPRGTGSASPEQQAVSAAAGRTGSARRSSPQASDADDQTLKRISMTSPSCDDVVLALDAELADLLGLGPRAELEELVPVDHLGPDEAPLEVACG